MRHFTYELHPVNMSTNGTCNVASPLLLDNLKPRPPSKEERAGGNGTSVAMDSAIYKKTFEIGCGASVKWFVVRKPSPSEIIVTPLCPLKFLGGKKMLYYNSRTRPLSSLEGSLDRDHCWTK